MLIVAKVYANETNDVKQIFQQHEVVSDVVPHAPNRFLKVL